MLLLNNKITRICRNCWFHFTWRNNKHICIFLLYLNSKLRKLSKKSRFCLKQHFRTCKMIFSKWSKSIKLPHSPSAFKATESIVLEEYYDSDYLLIIAVCYCSRNHQQTLINDHRNCIIVKELTHKDKYSLFCILRHQQS